MFIRIVSTPPGRSLESIREAWVGSEIQLITNQEIAAFPPGQWKGPAPSDHCHMVHTRHAIESLEKRGLDAIAQYWKDLVPLGLGPYICFPKWCCVVLMEQSS